MLTTSRLFLMPATLPMLEAAVAQDWTKLSSLLGGVSFADNWNRFPEALLWMRDYLKANPSELGWWSYFIIQGLDGRLAGTCGYKGAPNKDGAVEIGYEIADRYQNQGLATEAAQALIANAFKNPLVKSVIAHTLPEENPSVQILRNLKFNFEGEVMDLTDGKIWAWKLPKIISSPAPTPKIPPKTTKTPPKTTTSKKNKKK